MVVKKTDTYLLKLYYKFGALMGIFSNSFVNPKLSFFFNILNFFTSLLLALTTMYHLINFMILRNRSKYTMDLIVKLSFYVFPLQCLFYRLWGLFTKTNNWKQLFELITHLEKTTIRIKITKTQVIIHILLFVYSVIASLYICVITFSLDNNLLYILVMYLIFYTRIVYAVITLFISQVTNVLDKRMDYMIIKLKYLHSEPTVSKEETETIIDCVKDCYICINQALQKFNNIFKQFVYIILADQAIYILEGTNWFIYFENMSNYLNIILSISGNLISNWVS